MRATSNQPVETAPLETAPLENVSIDETANGQNNESNNDFKYRPDIDGLRAFAVLAVLGFHAFPQWIPGGFVGVDVFFVISGFLITSIIVQGIGQKTFQFGTFYRKRIRRIFPALLLVLICSYLFGWFTLIGMEYQSLGKHILGGVGFASNFILLEESGYFDKDSALKPLLHLWSLSIEEQFYIFWPLFLVLLHKVRVPLALGLFLLVGLSFGINIANLSGQPAAAFYHPFGRAWELAIGGLLAVLLLSHRPQLQTTFNRFTKAVGLRNEAAREIFSATGFLLTIAALFLLDSDNAYPGWWALLPTTGTLLVIAGGSQTWLNKKLLAHRVPVAIGLISFPLYLWHWPLLSYLHIFNGETLSPGSSFLALALSFLLAWPTYLFIEKPLRAGRRLTTQSSLLCIGLVAMGYIGVLSWAKYIAPRSGFYGLEKFSAATTEWDFPVEGVGGLDVYQGPLKPLKFGESTFYIQKGQLKHNVLYVGDSQMQVFSGRISHLIATRPEQHGSAVFATDVGCPPIKNIKRTNWTYHSCENFPQAALSYATKKEVETVVFGALWSGYLKDGLFYHESEAAPSDAESKAGKGKSSAGDYSSAYNELEKMIVALRKQEKRVYLILEAPMGQALNPARMVIRDFDVLQLKFDFKVDEDVGVTRSQLQQETGMVNQKLRAIARRTGSLVIDPTASLCGTQVCPAIDKAGEPIYKDEWHLRPTYMRERGTFIDQTVRR